MSKVVDLGIVFCAVLGAIMQILVATGLAFEVLRATFYFLTTIF